MHSARPFRRLVVRTISGLALASVTMANASATDASDGNMIVARGGIHSILLWDATPVVSQEVSAKKSSDVAMRDIESKALSLAASKAALLPNAQTLTVRVVYQQTGAVSPTYKTATFAGVEKLLTLDVGRSDLVAHSAAYRAALDSGSTPRQIRITQTGKLP